MPPSITETTGLPADLAEVDPIFETTEEAGPRRAASAQRLYPDGRVYSWSNTRRTLENGLPKRVPAPFQWRLDAQVSPEGVAEVRALMGAEAFRSLPPAMGAPVPDRGNVAVRAVLDGQQQTVVLKGSAAAKPPDPIRAIQLAIQRNTVSGAVPLEN